MLTDDAIRAVAAHLQTAYDASASPGCVVLPYWPDEQLEPIHAVIILHEIAETDANIGNGLRSTATPDTLMATYQLPAFNVTNPAEFNAAQRQSRLDKAVLGGAFRQAGNGDLDALILEIGGVIHISHPRGGPFDSTQDRIRITWDATIMVTPAVHT